jgi:hypothetical protein
VISDEEARQIAMERCRIAREAWRNATDGDAKVAALHATFDAWAWVARARCGNMPWRVVSEFRAALEGPEDRLFDRGGPAEGGEK